MLTTNRQRRLQHWTRCKSISLLNSNFYNGQTFRYGTSNVVFLSENSNSVVGSVTPSLQVKDAWYPKQSFFLLLIYWIARQSSEQSQDAPPAYKSLVASTKQHLASWSGNILHPTENLRGPYNLSEFQFLLTFKYTQKLKSFHTKVVWALIV